MTALEFDTCCDTCGTGLHILAAHYPHDPDCLTRRWCRCDNTCCPNCCPDCTTPHRHPDLDRYDPDDREPMAGDPYWNQDPQ